MTSTASHDRAGLAASRCGRGGLSEARVQLGDGHLVGVRVRGKVRVGVRVEVRVGVRVGVRVRIRARARARVR
eukprot:scaffold47153_cov58-Phaeocystis_antarctica.AAC.1